nr:hypothetical protein [Frateuria aurantia]
MKHEMVAWLAHVSGMDFGCAIPLLDQIAQWTAEGQARVAQVCIQRGGDDLLALMQHMHKQSAVDVPRYLRQIQKMERGLFGPAPALCSLSGLVDSGGEGTGGLPQGQSRLQGRQGTGDFSRHPVKMVARRFGGQLQTPLPVPGHRPTARIFQALAVIAVEFLEEKGFRQGIDIGMPTHHGLHDGGPGARVSDNENALHALISGADCQITWRSDPPLFQIDKTANV